MKAYQMTEDLVKEVEFQKSLQVHNTEQLTEISSKVEAMSKLVCERHPKMTKMLPRYDDSVFNDTRPTHHEQK